MMIIDHLYVEDDIIILRCNKSVSALQRQISVQRCSGTRMGGWYYLSYYLNIYQLFQKGVKCNYSVWMVPV